MLRRAWTHLQTSANKPASTSSIASIPCTHNHHLSQRPALLTQASRRGTLDERLRRASRAAPLSYQARSLFSAAGRCNLFFEPSSSSYFSSARSDVSISRYSSTDVTSFDQSAPTFSTYHMIPETIDPPAHWIGTPFSALCLAIRDRNSYLAWQEFQLLSDQDTTPPPEVLDSLFSLIAQGPDQTAAAGDPNRLATLIDHVCQQLLSIRKAKSQSTQRFDPALNRIVSIHHGDNNLHKLLKTDHLQRLVFLLILKAEILLHLELKQDAATASAQVQDLGAVIADLETITQERSNSGEGLDSGPLLELDLRCRLATSIAQLGDIPLATKQLEALVRYARATNQSHELTSNVFEKHLGLATAYQPEPSVAFLPSPINRLEEQPAKASYILDALRVTLAADVAPAKEVLRKALSLVETGTLWNLLPFKKENGSELCFSPRCHPWENHVDGLSVPSDTIEAFGDMVAIALSTRGELAPALHILQTKFPMNPLDDEVSTAEGLGPIKQSTAQPTGDLPDVDLFITIISFFTARIAIFARRKDMASKQNHLAVASDVRVLMHIYQAAFRSGYEIEPGMNDDMVKSLSVLLKSSVAKLGDFENKRKKEDIPRSQMARRNQDMGAVERLTLYLRQLTTAILTVDPTLNKGTLGMEAHSSLIGLHLKVRDYSYSKRLYQLIRARDPARELWSENKGSNSLYRIAYDRISAPDRSTFGWFFVEAIRASPQPHFAVRLYLDWVASGNSLTLDLAGIFISALLKAGLNAVAERLLRDMHEQRIAIPPHLAKTFVATFADAGYPEHAIAMATSLTDAWKEQQQSLTNEPGHFPDPNDALRPSLDIYSVALDRASKGPAEWTAERKAGLFKLFDEFRLALGHSLGQTDDSNLPKDRRGISIETIRLAYNAALRTHLEHHSDLQDSMEHSIDPGSVPAEHQIDLPTINQITRQQIHRLVDEMKELGVEADGTTWGCLLLSDLLYDEPRARGQKIITDTYSPRGQAAQKRLLRAMQTFSDGNASTYTKEGPLGKKGKRMIREKEVLFKSAIVGRLMYNLTRGGQFEMAERVYTIWKLRDAAHHQKSATSGVKGWDKGVEGARVYLLAAQGKDPEWRKELDQLVKKGYKLSENWRNQLESVSRTMANM